ncbi:MAG: MotA/TolQ/ExbB proton channel family protein [Betaproteobacteria bacterium]|nr:MotA/TolQ/ExbB proton channel family protein [Betaproteobacteria bacterium]
MQPVQDLGIAHFLAHADPLGRGILVVLLTMSLLSWYLIISRALIHFLHWWRGEKFSRALARIDSLPALAHYLEQHPSTDPLTALAAAGVDAGRKYEALRRSRGSDDPAPAELLVRDFDDAVAAAGTRIEGGLIVLASVGSSAPYIGLLGTVWGVYHALVSIGLSGQGTLDKVAGPVGEALIMTALGLAVAIPAVLGYNGLVRANRVTMGRITSLANRLIRTITTGEPPASAGAARPGAGATHPAASGAL